MIIVLILAIIYKLAGPWGQAAIDEAEWQSQRDRDIEDARKQMRRTGRRGKPEDLLPEKMPIPV